MQDTGKKTRRGVEDRMWVVTDAEEQGFDCVTNFSGKEVAVKQDIGFHVPDGDLNGRALPQLTPYLRAQAAFYPDTMTGAPPA